MKHKGHLIVIVAPSGTGKSSLVRRIKTLYPDIKESVSFTTRPIRPGEVDGKDYNYINEEQFKVMIAEKEFLEWAKVHSNYYGTSKKYVEQSIAIGTTLLFELDVQGADSMKSHFSDEAKVIFLSLIHI